MALANATRGAHSVIRGLGRIPLIFGLLGRNKTADIKIMQARSKIHKNTEV